MKYIIVLLATSLLVGTAHAATRFNFNSNCRNTVHLYSQVSGGGIRLAATIPYKGSYSEVQQDGTEIRYFDHGATGKTKMEFAINSNGRDYYNVNTVNGFDMGVKIDPSASGQNVKCTHQGCSDGYPHVFTTETGGTFAITLCPPKK